MRLACCGATCLAQESAEWRNGWSSSQSSPTAGYPQSIRTRHLTVEIDGLAAVFHLHRRGNHSTSAASRCMNSTGDITMWVMLSGQGVFSLTAALVVLVLPGWVMGAW